MWLSIQIKKEGGINYLYLGDAIYIIDKETIKWFGKESITMEGVIEREKLFKALKRGNIQLYSLWNLIFYDILSNKGRR